MKRRDLLKSIPMLTGSVVFSSCAGITSALIPNYLISSNMIISRLLPHFPYSQSAQGIGQVRLTNPAVSFAPDINKVRLNLGVEAGLSNTLSQLTGIKALDSITKLSTKGSCQIACGLRYQKETRGIYLQNPTVEKLQLSNIPAQYADQSKSLINTLAPHLFNQYPIHTLEASLATRFLGSMTVKSNGIALGFGI